MKTLGFSCSTSSYCSVFLHVPLSKQSGNNKLLLKYVHVCIMSSTPMLRYNIILQHPGEPSSSVTPYSHPSNILFVILMVSSITNLLGNNTLVYISTFSLQFFSLRFSAASFDISQGKVTIAEKSPKMIPTQIIFWSIFFFKAFPEIFSL